MGTEIKRVEFKLVKKSTENKQLETKVLENNNNKKKKTENKGEQISGIKLC